LESLRAKLAETEEELASTRRAVSLLEEKLQCMPALEEKVRGMADLEARVKDVERLEERVKALGEREDRLREGGAAASLQVAAVRGITDPASEDCMADVRTQRLPLAYRTFIE
jgi:chromosome segregation ATPase